MKLTIDIPNSMVTLAQARELASMQAATLVVRCQDGTGIVVECDLIPPTLSTMELLELKARHARKS